MLRSAGGGNDNDHLKVFVTISVGNKGKYRGVNLKCEAKWSVMILNNASDCLLGVISIKTNDLYTWLGYYSPTELIRHYY